MKKLAIGCLVVLVLVCVVAAGLGYYAYWQFRGTVAQLSELGQIPDLERGLRVRDPFVAPATEELTHSQVERFVRVQGAVRQRIGERLSDFERKYELLSKKENATIGDVPEILSAYRDLASGWMDAKRSQIDALNEAAMSLDEYRWIREQVYRAIGVPYADFDIGKIAEDVRGGLVTREPGQLRGSVGPTGPESNRKLVEPFRKQLEESVALASFGL